ncbi:MAG TPA: ABC transporter permease [Saprospiraceae bacterium]|nr:ABC transporter permease [Saprospiraceae bacterium]
MNNLLLIIRREYLTRVKKRTFILATIITPFAFALFFVVVGLIFSYESDDKRRIAVIDEGNILNEVIKDEKNLYFKFVEEDLESMKANFDDKEFDGILVIPEISDVMQNSHTIYYYADDQPSLDIEVLIRQRISSAVRNYKIDQLQFDRKELEALDTQVVLEPEPLSEKGEDGTRMTGAIAAFLGMVMGFIMYLTVFIYGMMVMRSVMEEKTSRIVEVMISSVRPFELMLGKIIGVGGVGLTQVAIWAVMIPSLFLLVQLIFGIDPSVYQSNSPGGGAAAGFDPDDMEAMMALTMSELSNMNWWAILPLFVLYFLGGYFLYSSLFAAVGSAIGDDLGEGQSLTLPITIPVILALYIMIAAVQAPNSSLAVGSSFFPLFSPIVMPARLAFGPPVWEVVLSLSILIGTSLFFVWLAGRIYRVGILMYGKKSGFKAMLKWIFTRD